MFRTICLYCEKQLSVLEEHDTDTELISHGYCADCVERAVAGTGEEASAFFDALPGPIFVVGKDKRIAAANKMARQSLNKELDQIEGRLGGEVFECINAKLPGGCGETVHCKACTIRKTVTLTAETGVLQNRVPAYMDLGDITGVKTVRFLISTENVNGAVLLRIDEATPVEAEATQ